MSNEQDPRGAERPGHASEPRSGGPAGALPPEAPEVPGPGPGPSQQAGPDVISGRQRLRAGLWPPRVSRAQLIVALLLFVLGLGLAIQVKIGRAHV